MILEVLGWLAVADAVAAVLFAAVLWVIGRRSGHPVPAGTAAGLAGCLTLPAILFYGIAWLWVRRLWPE